MTNGFKNAKLSLPTKLFIDNNEVVICKYDQLEIVKLIIHNFFNKN